MRVLVVLLLVANLVLFFWLQREHGSDRMVQRLPEPEIGYLQLVDVDAVDDHVPATRIGAPSAGESDDAIAASGLPVSLDSLPGAEDFFAWGLSPESSLPALAGLSEDVNDPHEVDSILDQLMADMMAARLSDRPAQGHDSTLPRDAPAAEVRMASVDRRQCLRIGPLSHADAQRLGSAIDGLSRLPDEQAQVAKIDGYYVMTPTLDTPRAAQDRLEDLAAAGFQDLWLFRSGEFRNAISLGLFSRVQTARAHAENLQRKGFEVMVRDKISYRNELLAFLQGDQSLAANPALAVLPEDARIIVGDCQ